MSRLQTDEGRTLLATEMSGLGIRYDLGDGHPLVGRRMPDLDATTSAGDVRVFTLLHSARPLLLNFGESAQSRSRDGPAGYTAWMRATVAPGCFR